MRKIVLVLFVLVALGLVFAGCAQNREKCGYHKVEGVVIDKYKDGDMYVVYNGYTVIPYFMGEYYLRVRVGNTVYDIEVDQTIYNQINAGDEVYIIMYSNLPLGVRPIS